MKIATYYTNTEIEHSLGKRFGFDYYDQDWDLVNANSERISEFISYFLTADNLDEMVAMFDLTIASMDDLESKIEQSDYLNQIKPKFFANLDLFMNTIIYWSSIGTGKEPDQMWTVTPLVRGLLDEITSFERFEIECNEVYCINTVGHRLLDLIDGKKLNFTFDELMKEIRYPNKLQLNDKTNLELDSFDKAFYWSIFSSNSQSLFKFDKEQYFTEIKKHET